MSGNHTYPKTDSLEYSLAFSDNSYSYPLTLLVHHTVVEQCLYLGA